MQQQEQDTFALVSRELEKYERFISDIERVVAIYERKFSKLIEEIRSLRVNRVKQSQKVVLEIDPREVSPFEDLGTQQLLKKTWRVIAKKTHPDLGGDPRIFVYARVLYKSGDLKALNALLESVNKGDFGSYLSFVRTKLQALYEARKATLGYRVLCLHRLGKFDEAEALVEKELLQIKLRLSTSLE